MNTDKIYAEQIANEYSKKETSKVKQLKTVAKVKKDIDSLVSSFADVKEEFLNAFLPILCKLSNKYVPN